MVYTIGVVLLFSVFAVGQGGVIHDKARIVNGQDVTFGELPYQVSIQRIGDSLRFCGGSILNKYYVLTAAHCVDEVDPKILKVIAGTIYKHQPQSTHRVLDIRVHQNYTPSNSWINDIALIKVYPLFKLGKNIIAVKLPKANTLNKPGEKAIISGWGSLYENGPDANTLQKAEIIITGQDYCRNVYAELHLRIHDSQFCAHDPIEEHGSCKGESGGPLAVDGILIGIISGSWGCTSVYYPNVFTRVSNYVDWIQNYSV